MIIIINNKADLAQGQIMATFCHVIIVVEMTEIITKMIIMIRNVCRGYYRTISLVTQRNETASETTELHVLRITNLELGHNSCTNEPEIFPRVKNFDFNTPITIHYLIDGHWFDLIF